jgi:hypothetical protein
MKILDVSETSDWLRERGIDFIPAPHAGSDHRAAFEPEGEGVEFILPSRAREQLVLAHQLGRWFESTRALVVVTVVTAFTDGELDAFLELRRYYGHEEWASHTPGGGTPGHLLDNSARENQRTLTEILFLLMLLNFEGFAVESSGRSIILAGDDIWTVRTRDRAKARKLDELLATVDVRRIRNAGNQDQ